MNDKDTIYRQAAIDAIRPLQTYKLSEGDEMILVDKAEVQTELMMLTSAQPERKKGKWEICNILDYAQRPTGRKILRCPFCGYLTDEFWSMVDYYHKRTRFCPNCGAEMKGKANDEN